MILPYLYYCDLAWGGTYKANLQRIVILQKRALRIVNNSTYDANTGPIYKELKLFKFHDIHSFQLGFFIFYKFSYAWRLIKYLRGLLHEAVSETRTACYGINVSKFQ